MIPAIMMAIMVLSQARDKISYEAQLKRAQYEFVLSQVSDGTILLTDEAGGCYIPTEVGYVYVEEP